MDQAVKKANSTLGFVRRNLRISNEQTKSAAYLLLEGKLWSTDQQSGDLTARNTSAKLK